MPSKRKGLLEALREMPNDSSTKTLLVTLAVTSVCALLVSTAAVLLRPVQLAHQEREREEQILGIASRLPGIEQLMGTIEAPRLESRLIELETGRVIESGSAADYDLLLAASDPRQSVELPPDEDIAGIQRRALFAPVHLLMQEDEVKLHILPVYGSGYASTLQGYLALAEDGNTVAALTFYQHKETPGIGTRIDRPEWRSQWQGKKVRDEEGRLRIDIAAGTVPDSSPEAAYRVDGITGATRTTRGVANLVRFWLGDYGYGPYLARVRSAAAPDAGASP